MKERPILFSAPMVRAILAGTKTQTRRIVKPQPDSADIRFDAASAEWYAEAGCWKHRCPYGQAGDRLWVRETWLQTPAGLAYRADGGDHFGAGGAMKWKPSIFMPRWASRITLEGTGVRVERLQEISEDDAKAEGAPNNHAHFRDDFQSAMQNTYRRNYATIWESINGAGSWDLNPFVWVVEFKRLP